MVQGMLEIDAPPQSGSSTPDTCVPYQNAGASLITAIPRDTSVDVTFELSVTFTAISDSKVVHYLVDLSWSTK